MLEQNPELRALGRRDVAARGGARGRTIEGRRRRRGRRPAIGATRPSTATRSWSAHRSRCRSSIAMRVASRRPASVSRKGHEERRAAQARVAAALADAYAALASAHDEVDHRPLGRAARLRSRPSTPSARDTDWADSATWMCSNRAAHADRRRQPVSAGAVRLPQGDRERGAADRRAARRIARARPTTARE